MCMNIKQGARRMISRVRGCMTTLLTLTFFLLLSTAFTAAVEKLTAPEYWSREEMAKMAGYGEEKLSTVLVTGSVVCQDCSHGHSQSHLPSSPIPGAVVAVNCRGGSKGRSGGAEAITDEYGEFLIDLPSHLHGVSNLHRKCNAKVVRLPKNSGCRPAYVMRQKGLRLSSVGNGIRTYTAGKVTFHLLAPKTSRLRSAGGGDQLTY